MPKFGKRSKERLSTCDLRLQQIMNEVIKIMDITVLCGHRTEEEQTKAFTKGYSKVEYPNSDHNKLPSMAVDIAPWVDGGIPWDDKEKFYEMAGVVKAIAHTMNYYVDWGGDFKSFFDGPHFQLGRPND